MCSVAWVLRVGLINRALRGSLRAINLIDVHKKTVTKLCSDAG